MALATVAGWLAVENRSLRDQRDVAIAYMGARQNSAVGGWRLNWPQPEILSVKLLIPVDARGRRTA
jgi:hypothetical protein